MKSFNTFTQYDNEKFGHHEKLGYNKTACTFFSLLASYNYMNDNDTSKAKHEKNIAVAVNNFVMMDINQQMTFEEILQFTTLKLKDVIGTSVELIKNNIIGYDQMFAKPSASGSTVLFLKNGKFFVVFFKDDKYFLRDCHEKQQYDFENKNELINHLNSSYQFNKDIDLDGYTIPEYSSIEFLVINEKFTLNMITDLDHVDMDADVPNNSNQFKTDDEYEDYNNFYQTGGNNDGFVNYDDIEYDESKYL
jgi:hypothetical protein